MKAIFVFFSAVMVLLGGEIASWAAEAAPSNSDESSVVEYLQLKPLPIIADAPPGLQVKSRPDTTGLRSRQDDFNPALTPAEPSDIGPPVIGDNYSVAILEEEKEIADLERTPLSDTFYVPVVQSGDTAVRIVIYRRESRLRVFQGGDLIRTYTVALGRKGHRTPLGKTRIVSKIEDPTYIPRDNPDQPIPPGPKNPVGARWLGLSWEHYGIHGTNNPASIGKAVSSGCIRMRDQDVKDLYELVSVGTKVEVVQ